MEIKACFCPDLPLSYEVDYQSTPRPQTFAHPCSKPAFTKVTEKNLSASLTELLPSNDELMSVAGLPTSVASSKNRTNDALTFCYRVLFSQPDVNKRQIFLL